MFPRAPWSCRSVSNHWTVVIMGLSVKSMNRQEEGGALSLRQAEQIEKENGWCQLPGEQETQENGW